MTLCFLFGSNEDTFIKYKLPYIYIVFFLFLRFPALTFAHNAMVMA